MDEYNKLITNFETKLAIDKYYSNTNSTTNSNSNEQAATTTDAPKKKERKTLFWGISVNPDIVLNHLPIKIALEANPLLVPLKKMHSTLLYVGRKDNDNEAVYMDLIGKDCRIVVKAHGCSENAIALEVDSITFVDSGEPVKSFNAKQHVTVALTAETKAVDSVKSFVDGTMINYDEPLVLEGKLLRYFF